MIKHYDAETLDDYLHGELTPDADAAIHAHLETCSTCRALHEESAALRDWLRTQAHEEEVELPSLVKARVWERVRTPAASPLARLRAFWQPLVALPVAAALALAAFFAVPAVHRQPIPAVGIAATELLELHAVDSRGNPLADRGLITTASMTETGPVLETDGSADGR